MARLIGSNSAAILTNRLKSQSNVFVTKTPSMELPITKKESLIVPIRLDRVQTDVETLPGIQFQRLFVSGENGDFLLEV